MTSAKPQSMAAQTDAPDDLIAELARLMADDARSSDQNTRTPPAPAAENAAPVRIPGGEVRVEAEKPAPVRIPGAAPAPEEKREPFNFDFVLNDPPRHAGPATPVPPVEAKPAAPASIQPESEELDHDGLADLIAAELANDLAPAEPAPVAEGPARGADNFGVPPVFGLGAPATPQAVPVPMPEQTPAPVIVAVEPVADEPLLPAEPVPEAPVRPDEPAATDPLTDIERLLAPVVQKAQQDAARSPSPALRSLATPTLPAAEPRVETPASRQSEPGSVDDAILAAAAATGAQVEWVNSEIDRGDAGVDELAAMAPPPRRGFTMSRAVAGPLVAVGLLAVAGVGLYWVLGQGGAPSGPAPLVLADNAAVKDVPEPVEQSGQQSVVFNEISGGTNPADEQLVPRDQADEAALTEAAAGTGGPGVLAGDDGTAIDPNQEGLVNRKVRTVTVRPDGTIISGTDSMAGASILPVERPNVPDVPGADFSTPDLIASTIAAESATPAASSAETTPVPAVTPVTSGAVVPVVDASGATIPGRNVTVPVDRPADFAQLASAALAAAAVPPAAANTSANNALAAPPAQAATTQQPVAASGGSAAAYVQLASQRSEDAARQSAQAMATRYGVLFSGVSPEIQRVDLGERGIYYRVLVPAPSREAAANICTNVRAAGGDCLLL